MEYFGACDKFHVLATRQLVSCLVVHPFAERNTDGEEGTRFLMARPQERVTTSLLKPGVAGDCSESRYKILRDGPTSAGCQVFVNGFTIPSKIPEARSNGQ